MGCNSGTGTTTEYTPINQRDKEIDKIAKKTRDLKNEQYRIVNENGEVLIVKQGR